MRRSIAISIIIAAAARAAPTTRTPGSAAALCRCTASSCGDPSAFAGRTVMVSRDNGCGVRHVTGLQIIGATRANG